MQSTRNKKSLFNFSCLWCLLALSIFVLWFYELSVSFLTYLYLCVAILVLVFIYKYLGYPIISAPFIYAGYLILNMGLFSLIFCLPGIGYRISEETWWIRQIMRASLWYRYQFAVERSILLILLAIFSLMLGFTVARIKLPYNPKLSRIDMANHLRELYVGGIVALSACLIILLLSRAFTFGNYLQFFVSPTYQSDQRIVVTALMFAPIMVLLAAGGVENSKQLLKLFLLSLFVGLFIFLAGWRGLGFFTLVCALITIRKFKFNLVQIIDKYTIMLLLIAIFLSYGIGKMRAQEKVESPFLEGLIKSVWSASQQVETLVFTVQDINTGDPFLYGESYFNAFVRIVPNLSIRWSPSQSNIENLGHKLTRKYYPEYEGEYHLGVSFSGVAEAYINFGPFGVFLIYFVIGYVIIYLDYKSSAGTTWLSLFAIILFSLLMGTTKGESILVSRTLAWGTGYIFFLWIVKGILPRKRRSSSVRQTVESQQS